MGLAFLGLWTSRVIHELDISGVRYPNPVKLSIDILNACFFPARSVNSSTLGANIHHVTWKLGAWITQLLCRIICFFLFFFVFCFFCNNILDEVINAVLYIIGVQLTIILDATSYLPFVC